MPAAPREPVFDAVVFDMDGLLVDSEPLWRRAEMEVFPEVGVHLTEAQCAETTGLRIDEVVALRHRQRPWDEPSPAVVAQRIVNRVIELVQAEGRLLPGARAAVADARARARSLALASSSPRSLIEAVLARFDLTPAFAVVCSAEHEPAGKPHPAVFATAARRAGAHPGRCLAIEDSPNGVRAALAAGMVVLAVPEHDPWPSDPFDRADVVLPDLEALDDGVWQTLAGRLRTPSD